MGIFSRRRAPVAEATMWQPVQDDYETLEGVDADMDDGDQVTDHAHLAAFGSESAPDALISAWTYTVHAASGGYVLRLAFQYSAGSDENWVYSGYADDPLQEIYGDLDEAEADAQAWAAVLAAGNPDSMGNLSAVFEWDGEPFPVGDPG